MMKDMTKVRSTKLTKNEGQQGNNPEEEDPDEDNGQSKRALSHLEAI